MADQAEPAVTGPVSVAALVAWVRPILPGLVVVLAAAFAVRRLDNTDTWWHLAAGRWIAEHLTVPKTDTLSYTVPDHPWIDVQWLYELILYELYRAGGPTLLVLTSALAYTGASALLLMNLRFALGPVGAAVLGAWALLIMEDRFVIRPEMVSFVFLQAILWVCATWRQANRRFWLLPPLMLLWANTHALFVLGVLVIGCHLAGVCAASLPVVPAAWRRPFEPPARRRFILAATAALLVPLVNPYGLKGALFPLKLMSRISGANPVFRTIGEFHSPFSGWNVTLPVTAYRALVVLSVVLVAVAAALTALSGLDPAGIPRPIRAARRRGGAALAARRAERPARTSPGCATGVDVAGLLVFAAFAYLSLLARRNMALFALAGVPFVGQCASLLITRMPAAARRVADGAASTLAVSLPLGLVAALWLVATNHYYRWGGEWREFGTGVYEVLFPIRASTFIAEHKLPAPLYNDDTTGGYLAYARPVLGGVYIDGRLEVYDASFYTRYQDGLENPARWQAEADQRGIQTVILFHWWPNYLRLGRFLLGDRRWALVYFDETVFVFLRHEGNEALVAETTAAFATLRPQIEERLLSPVSSWGWPVVRALGLARYAIALGLMGKVDDAARFNERYLDLRPEPHEEARVALDLARYHTAKGDTGLAHLYLRRAARAEPDNPDVAWLTRRLDG